MVKRLPGASYTHQFSILIATVKIFLVFHSITRKISEKDGLKKLGLHYAICLTPCLTNSFVFTRYEFQSPVPSLEIVL